LGIPSPDPLDTQDWVISPNSHDESSPIMQQPLPGNSSRPDTGRRPLSDHVISSRVPPPPSPPPDYLSTPASSIDGDCRSIDSGLSDLSEVSSDVCFTGEMTLSLKSQGLTFDKYKTWTNCSALHRGLFPPQINPFGTGFCTHNV